MAIVSKIPELLKKNGKNASDLMRITGSAYSTAYYLAKGEIRDSIAVTLLDRICAYFHVPLSEVLEYVPDNQTTPEKPKESI
jgi:DNA-binding Xre family transcriptional regulator